MAKPVPADPELKAPVDDRIAVSELTSRQDERESRQVATSIVSWESEVSRLQLLRLHERKTDMLSTASHEVRATLHAITGLVDELREAPWVVPDPELLDVLGHASERLRSLVQQVLDVAQLQTNDVSLVRDTFDLRNVLRQVGVVVAAVLRGKAVTLNLHIDPQCQSLRVGDMGRISQILTNVATNSAKYTEHGAVSISVTATDSDIIRFVVADDGPGMPKFALERLTNPAARPASNERKAGLGLLITRELIELLQGQVEVTASPGAGTTVDIGIPLPEAVAFDAMSPERANAALFARALVVDDAPEGLDFMRRALQPVGGQVDSTSDTSLALHWAEKSPYDLVILDGTMSPHDGADLTRALRQMKTTQHSTIIVATASAEKVSSARYLAAGADLVLSKPFANTELIESLRRVRPARHFNVEPPSALDNHSPQRQALQMFAGAISGRMAAIRSALADQATDRTAPALHALASPAMVVGATRTGEYGLALETVMRAVGLVGLSDVAVDRLEIMALAEVAELLSSTAAGALEAP